MSAERLLVWWVSGRDVSAPAPEALAQGVDAYRAIDGPAELAYVALPAIPSDAARVESAFRAAYPNARITRQRWLADRPGASAAADAPFHYVVATDVLAGVEDDFNAWYEREHLPGLAGVPGTVRAQRLRNTDDAPRYHACYDLVAPQTLASPAWLAVRATDWSGRVRPAFRNTTRVMMRRR